MRRSPAAALVAVLLFALLGPLPASAQTASTITLSASAGKVVFGQSVTFTATVTSTAYTYEVSNGNQFEIPLNGYTGDVSVVTNAGSGTIRVTEVTA